MRAGVFSVMVLFGVTPLAAQAESYADDPAGQAPVVLGSVNTDEFSGGSGADTRLPSLRHSGAAMWRAPAASTISIRPA